MSQQVVDLSQPNIPLPDPVVLDTSVVAEFLRITHRTAPIWTARATRFFHDLVRREQQAILTPTGYTELLHVAIVALYKTVLQQQGRAALSSQLGTRIRHERDLLKHDPSILRHYAGQLAGLREALIASNVVIANPDHLGPIASGRTHQEELLHLIGHYGLDSNDASILLEAHRLGISAIVTMDRDMQRAAADFDIYTWLS